MKLERLHVDIQRGRKCAAGCRSFVCEEMYDRNAHVASERIRRGQGIWRKFEGCSGRHTPSFAEDWLEPARDSRIIL